MRGDLGPDGVKEETGCGFGGGQHAGPPGRGGGEDLLGLGSGR